MSITTESSKVKAATTKGMVVKESIGQVTTYQYFIPFTNIKSLVYQPICIDGTRYARIGREPAHLNRASEAYNEIYNAFPEAKLGKEVDGLIRLYEE